MSNVNRKKLDPDPLKKLKKILLEEDENEIARMQDSISKLRQQINDREALIETINPVIADALDRKIHESKDEMAEALAPVMGEAIRLQVEEAKEDVADALYPVIGRMSSKAVAEAMKKIIENINASVNRTLNFSLWVKRFKAKVLGVSTAEVLLAEQSQVGIKDIFFIAKESGLLIAHVGSENETKSVDPAIIGGMLTAIKMFARDAFHGDEQNDLQEIEYSDQTIKIDNGKYSYLAVVFTGIGGSDFSHELQKIHHRIHNRYYKYLKNYQGDNSHFIGIEYLLIRFINKFRASHSGVTH